MKQIARVLQQDPEDEFDNPNPPPVKKTVGSRLFFIWFLFCAIPLTAFFGIIAIVHHYFSPRFETLHGWSRIWSRLILGCTGINLEITNEGFEPGAEPVIFISNHQNSVDILAHCAGIPAPFAFLAKIELRDVPVLGSYLAKACIFVDRSSPRKAVTSIRQAADNVRNGQSVLIYPEGQRMWGPQMTEFMRGAFELAIASGVAIVPVVLLDSYKRMDERLYVGRPGKVRMIIGAPVSLQGKTRKDIPELQETLHDHIQSRILLSDL